MPGPVLNAGNSAVKGHVGCLLWGGRQYLNLKLAAGLAKGQSCFFLTGEVGVRGGGSSVGPAGCRERL